MQHVHVRCGPADAKKEDSIGTSKFLWDSENVLLETDASDITQVLYSLEPVTYGKLLSQLRGGSTAFFHFDAIGSTDRLTSTAGAVTDSYIYKAFGILLASSGTTVNAFRYVGRLAYYSHPDVGEYYLRARFYDSRTGRFLARDPAPEDEVNVYRYVAANPILFTDPGGYRSMKDCECRVPIVGPPRPPNGCSDPIGKGKNKDDPAGGCSFKECCDNHDNCYETCNSPKQQCDRTFRDCLKERCWLCFKIVDPWSRDKLQEWVSELQYQTCLYFAKQYAGNADLFGGWWYWDAQGHSCYCEKWKE